MDEILKVCFSHFMISSEFYFNGLFLPLPLCTFDVGVIESLQMRNNSANGTDSEAELLDFEPSFSHSLAVYLWTSYLMSLYLNALVHSM